MGLLTQLPLGLNESVDPAGWEQMYMWDAGTLGLSAVNYINCGTSQLKCSLALSVRSCVYAAWPQATKSEQNKTWKPPPKKSLRLFTWKHKVIRDLEKIRNKDQKQS